LALYDRYELLELRRDDGIQTFHAREIATARPVQFHLFGQDQSRENVALLSRIEYLPDAERRRVIERGEYQGRPYVITDRLAGYPGFREWLVVRTNLPERDASLDEQFLDLFDQPQTGGPAVAALPAILPNVGELDRQFYHLFDPDVEGVWMTAASSAGGSTSALLLGHDWSREPYEVESRGEVDEHFEGGPQATRPAPSAGRSLAGIVLGIIAAILVLGLLAAVLAFRPW